MNVEHFSLILFSFSSRKHIDSEKELIGAHQCLRQTARRGILAVFKTSRQFPASRKTGREERVG